MSTATMRMPDDSPSRGMATLALLASVALHVGIVAAFIELRPAAPPPEPPIYRVQMVAAPPGPPAIGAVTPTLKPQPQSAAPATPKVAPTPARTAPTKTPVPVKSTPTPTETKPTTASQQKAAGGNVGGAGTDVASVNTGGIDFPYPGYLENIVRQVALRFKPGSRGAVRAEVAFIIHRDGSVDHITLVTRSGVYAFDLEAQGAVEAAANAKAFGPLPTGFPNDVLPVVFRFDPRGLQ